LPDRFFGLRATASLGWQGGDAGAIYTKGEQGEQGKGERTNMREGERGEWAFF